MIKGIIGFILFAALGLWLLNRGGDIDLGGEKHEVPTAVEPAKAEVKTAPAPAPVPVATPAPAEPKK